LINQERNGGEQTIRLCEAVRAELVAHARAEAPRECCGLLVGRDTLIDDCLRSANLDPDPNRYEIDAGLHVAANRRLRGTGRAVIGAYHSHPRSPAWPSPSDVAEAYYADFIWMIVSLAEPEPAIKAFHIADGHVVELAIEPD
jgi:proteasome lid subunit RPN8/RPN11